MPFCRRQDRAALDGLELARAESGGISGFVHKMATSSRVLLEAGADIKAKTSNYGSTALHLAVFTRRGSRGTIRALLESGSNVNARLQDGGTPLHEACNESCVGAVEICFVPGPMRS